MREAAQHLKYVPNSAARSLITRRTHTVAIVVADITNPFYPELVEALHDELTRENYQCILLNERTDTREGAVGALLRSHAVDGAILATATTDAATRALLSDRSTPIVLLNRHVEGMEVDVVVSDNRHGGALIAEHFAALGHVRIGLIGGPANTSTAAERELGFVEALRRLGLDLDPRLARKGEFLHRTGYQWCLDLLQEPDPPTAIFCGSDAIAVGALDAARSQRVDVPSELSLVGFDDISLAGWESVRLTTVRQPIHAMAREAARMLLWRISVPPSEPPRRVVFPTELIQRRTTAPPRRRKG